MAAPAILTRSQVEVLDFSCLWDVGTYLDAAAELPEEAFTDVWQATASADWKGQGHD